MKTKDVTADPQAYRNWRQADERYNQEEAWPASLFPEAKFHIFRECGCLITSLAIMLRHFGIEKEGDEELFNPWILNERLIRAGAFDPAGNLILSDLNKLYPIEYIGSTAYTEEGLKKAVASGEPFLITVPGIRGEHHFIVPDHMEGDDLATIDCAWEKEYLSQFDTICELRLFMGRTG